MTLAGLQKNSFIDFPGRISCVLFTSGCNFVCPYCHNADLARGRYPERIATADVTAFLKARRGLLEGVVITGGEPTLHKDLIDLCQTVQALGYPVKLDTNGSRPDLLRRLLEERLVDYIAMDVKAPMTAYAPFCRHPRITDQLAESIRLIMDAAPAYEFRTTCAGPFADEAAIETIAATIQGAACYALQGFNPHAACLDPDFTRRHPHPLTADRMQRLQRLAAPYVRRCILR